MKSLSHSSLFFFFFNKFIYLFIFVCLGSSLLSTGFLFFSCSEQGLLFVVVHKPLIVVASLVVEQGSRRTGFSSCGTWAQQLWSTGSRAQAQ